MSRIFSFAAALTLPAVFALPSAGLAAPSGGAALPPSGPAAPSGGVATALRAGPDGVPVPPAGGPDAQRLTAALLAAPELPAGFAPQPDAVDDLFARIPAEIAACGKATGVAPGAVYREYLRGTNDEELLIETLAAPGDEAARAAVAALAGTLPACKSFTRAPGELPAEMRFAISAHPDPGIGDVSAGLAFVMTVPDMNLTVNGRLLTAATHGLHVTVLLMTEDAPKTADLEAATRAAVAKLKDLR
ncbi:hypothetical protein QLQ12_15365 [Actinoplanes sp. NEAU-A12]|uniref:PknH-like extracellular domain-containing protein n=1 Tax=Actinoplanes sandaracinus TaxID=3045177 RepID=A0ABT6WJS3_9ACTN|nr:hypothetical protein [Actinoplanes sandaracinus]MDI6099979.1 hypothetical protein [Actinoplanes sandaracinus]